MGVTPKFVKFKTFHGIRIHHGVMVAKVARVGRRPLG
jgi:hypothetical protein